MTKRKTPNKTSEPSLRRLSQVMLSLPFPPTLNHNVRSGYGMRFRTRQYRAFIENVYWIWRTEGPRRWNKQRRYAVVIVAYMPDKRKRDLDNIIKPTLDALTHAGAWDDDSQVDSITILRAGVRTEKPGIEIVIAYI